MAHRDKVPNDKGKHRGQPKKGGSDFSHWDKNSLIITFIVALILAAIVGGLIYAYGI